MLTFCSCGYFVASILPHSLTNASIRRICPIRMTLNSLHVEAASAYELSAQRIVGEAFAGHTQEIL